MARRVSVSIGGMRISKPGFDARLDPDANMMFSSNRRFLMVISSGVFVLGNPSTIPYGVDVGQIPLVWCGTLSIMAMGYPVIVYPYTDHFVAYPKPWPSSGQYPALGTAVNYLVYMKSRS